MPRISQRSIEQVWNTAEVEEVISDYVSLKKRGSNYMGLCPFHNEKTPSFVVSPAKEIYKCFGCGEAGNAVSFIMEHDGLSYYDAIHQIASKYNIELEYESLNPEEKREQLEKDSLLLIMEFAANFYQKQLFESEEGKSIGLPYFKKRGFNQKILEKFNVGYSPASGSELTNAINKAQYDESKMQELGLKNKYGNDFFRDRIIFPIRNFSGKVVAFAGRTMKTNSKQPKYINSPETEIYEKRKILYGLYEAKSSIRRKRNVFIVEGYTDVLSMVQEGIDNVVATAGTSLTDQHITILKRHTDKVTLIFDSDKAGINAAERGSKIILKQGLNLDIVILPDGDDPDSFTQSRGKDGFWDYVDSQGVDYILYKLDEYSKINKNNPSEATNYIRNILSTIAVIPDSIQQNIYIQKSSEVLNLDENVLRNEIEEIKYQLQKQDIRQERKKEARKNLKKVQKKKPEKKKPLHYYQEKDLVRILLEHGNKTIEEDEKEFPVIKKVIDEIEFMIDSFYDDTFKSIILEYKNAFSNGEILDNAHFVKSTDKEIRNTSIDILAMKEEMSINWVEKWDYPLQTQPTPETNHLEDTLQSLRRLKSLKINSLIQENLEDINSLLKSEGEENSDKMNELLEVNQYLMNMRSETVSKEGTVVYTPKTEK